MADRTYQVALLYRAREEVLTLNFLYLDTDQDPVDAQAICEDLAQFFSDQAASLDTNVGSGFMKIGCSVYSPALPNNAAAKHIYAGPAVYSGTEIAPDSMTAVLKLSGTRATDGKRTRGNLKFSGIPLDQIDCNGLDDAYAQNLEAALIAILQQTVTSQGRQLLLVIDSTFNEVQEFVLVDQIRLNRVVGSHIERIQNRPQGRPSRNGAPAPP